MVTAKFTDIEKGTRKLLGILQGISIDYEVTVKELDSLKEWLELHGNLKGEPFKTIRNEVKKILADRKVDDEEQDRLIEICSDLVESDSVSLIFTDAVRTLHGVLAGIAADGKVTDEEVEGLYDWLLEFEHFSSQFPFSTTWELINRICEDGVVSDLERKELLDFSSAWIEVATPDQQLHDANYSDPWMKTKALLLKPFTELCIPNSEGLEFKEKVYCFTGPAAIGSRKKLEGVVGQLGGFTKPRYSKVIDYLVIGAKSSPAWVYETYGRKIEEVIRDWQFGGKTKLITEDHFVSRAKSAGAKFPQKIYKLKKA